jgi:hypothetical protein
MRRQRGKTAKRAYPVPPSTVITGGEPARSPARFRSHGAAGIDGWQQIRKDFAYWRR